MNARDLRLFEQEKELDLILLGRICLDINPIDYNCPLWESTTFKKYIGGSPANTAIGFSRLGGKAGFLGRISDDALGTYAERVFQEEGIDASRIVRCTDGSRLGLAITEILDESHSSILMYRDNVADLKLSPEDIGEDYIRSAKALLISGTSLAQSPSREAALKALALAKKNGVTVIFDVDYRAHTWKSLDEVSVYYADVARQSDIIMGSREELDLTERFLALDGTDETSARFWFDQNCRVLIIKHGKEGSFGFVKGDGTYRVRPFPTKLLKSFGGGDGYASSFLYGLINGYDLHDCFTLATASASMLVSSHACSADMPSLSALEAYRQEGVARHGEMVSRTEEKRQEED